MARIPSTGHLAPTLEDVARLAGVSRATVSRVVNGAELVAPATAEAVQAAIKELHYQPNRAARALVTRRTGAIAVVVPEGDERVFNDPFFPQLYHGALQAFQHTDVQVVLSIGQPGESSGRMLRYLESGHVDGAIVASHHGPALARVLGAIPQPVVFIGDPETPGLPFVDVDQADAAWTATKYLLSRGPQRIGSITGPLDMHAGKERLRGFRRAMLAAGRSAELLADGDFSTIGGRIAARRLLAAEPELDGLFVANDLMAVGAMAVLREAGRRVPEDVLVVGFDNTAAVQTTPLLTTMTNPASELARIAAEMLITMLAGEPTPSPVILSSELVVRGTA